MTREKWTRVLTWGLVLMMIVCTLCACGEKSEKGFVTLILSAEGEKDVTYQVNLDRVGEGEGLIGLLKVLKADGKLDYTVENSDYGPFLTAVGNVRQDTDAGVYVFIWTSVAKDADTSEYATTKMYGEVKLTSSAVGAGSMTLEKDAVYCIGTIKY